MIRARQAGFTLIEVMIALLIGVIGIVIMMQTFSVAEGFKRTATSGTDAQVNGAVALYLLERELRMAGFGMSTLVTQGCPSVRVWNNLTSTGTDLDLFPVEINPAGFPAGDANTDTLLVSYGKSDSFVVGIQATQNPSRPVTDPFQVSVNWDSFHTGDLFVSVQPGATISCALNEATVTAPAAGNCGVTPTSKGWAGNNYLVHDTASYKNSYKSCALVPPTFNSASGITNSSGAVVPRLVIPTGGQVFNLGDAQVKIYAIIGGNLTSCDVLRSNCTNQANYSILVNDIVSMRAVYGMNLAPSVSAAAGDGVTITYNRNSLTSNVFLPSRVYSLALEITSRSSLYEKPRQGTVCDATPTASRPDRAQDWLYQATTGAGIDLSTVSADWSCYRYKLFQTNVPMRNLIWRP
jgi:type IV pilus assembly protein PilW